MLLLIILLIYLSYQYGIQNHSIPCFGGTLNRYAGVTPLLVQ
jgi:hypothetical protein